MGQARTPLEAYSYVILVKTAVSGNPKNAIPGPIRSTSFEPFIYKNEPQITLPWILILLPKIRLVHTFEGLVPI